MVAKAAKGSSSELEMRNKHSDRSLLFLLIWPLDLGELGVDSRPWAGPVLENSCFSLELRTGVTIIAVLELLNGLSYLSFASTPDHGPSSQENTIAKISIAVYGGIELIVAILMLVGINTALWQLIVC
ncbi:hypothetical protein MSG28_003772 [Choristoneura fumiferana]|uniref:Uncharacterized protein n=1 Tax=Choristoneura fumiferana TaxID=7141 RepID=A0ACC0KG52_CHOFU|nr:hypothetical protein MSG28_003772 [Choristoneura fumiferana]